MVEGVERLADTRLAEVRGFIAGLFQQDLHAKRVEALSGATLGVMTSASLAVSVIGQALAQARGLVPKHAIKQVDRLLSNQGIDVWDSFAHWVPHVVGTRQTILVAMDWTEFDGDGQATLALHLVTGQGRTTPLLWLSVWKDELTDQRNAYEDACLVRLSEVLPAGCQVTLLADRGFGDHKLFAFLAELGFGYVIRFRGNIHVTDASGETRPAAAWVGKAGRARKLRGARVTAQQHPVGTVVCIHARGMQDPWCLSASGISEPTRRDRLLLINAFAMALLTLLGAAGESLGLDRLLKSNTTRSRTHSLFRQGCLLYDLIPTMPEHRLVPLMTRFAKMLAHCNAFNGLSHAT